MPDARHTYAAWNEDLSEIKGCSSGGAAYLMSRFLIERHGVVYASAFGEDSLICSLSGSGSVLISHRTFSSLLYLSLLPKSAHHPESVLPHPKLSDSQEAESNLLS